MQEKQPSGSKKRDQIGIILLICGVVLGMGVSVGATRGMAMWLEIVGLVIGLILVVVGLWMARAFRQADPKRPHKPDQM
jgi:hypothetical protein